MPRASTSISRKQQLLLQAAMLFRSQGYQASTMRHLAKAMNMEAASLYNHTGSKNQLLEEICNWVADAFMQNMSEVEASEVGPQAQVEKLLGFQLQLMLNHFDFIYVSNRDWKHLEAEAKTRYLHQRRNYELRFAAIMKGGMEEGIFRNADTSVLVPAMLSALRSVEYWQRNRRGISAQTFSNQIIQWLMHSLKNS